MACNVGSGIGWPSDSKTSSPRSQNSQFRARTPGSSLRRLSSNPGVAKSRLIMLFHVSFQSPQPTRTPSSSKHSKPPWPQPLICCFPHTHPTHTPASTRLFLCSLSRSPKQTARLQRTGPCLSPRGIPPGVSPSTVAKKNQVRREASHLPEINTLVKRVTKTSNRCVMFFF